MQAVSLTYWPLGTYTGGVGRCNTAQPYQPNDVLVYQFMQRQRCGAAATSSVHYPFAFALFEVPLAWVYQCLYLATAAFSCPTYDDSYTFAETLGQAPFQQFDFTHGSASESSSTAAQRHLRTAPGPAASRVLPCITCARPMHAWPWQPGIICVRPGLAASSVRSSITGMFAWPCIKRSRSGIIMMTIMICQCALHGITCARPASCARGPASCSCGLRPSCVTRTRPGIMMMMCALHGWAGEVGLARGDFIICKRKTVYRFFFFDLSYERRKT